VYEYSKKFNHLSQYGSYHADTNEKKMSLFRQGLSPMLHENLTLFRGCTLNELVSTSIEQEDVCRARLEEERKKRPLPAPNGGAPPKYCLIYTLPSVQPCTPPLHRSSGASVHLSRWPIFSRLPMAGWSTLSSITGWGRVSVLQLWANWTLLP
jgi:hypothetical protein